MILKINKYLDLQVNGYAGVDFNTLDLTEEKLEFACKKLSDDNVEGILATIITDDFNNMILKIGNLVKILEKNSIVRSIIKGLHIEGPFLNPQEGFRGAHPEQYIIQPDLEKVKALIESGAGYIKLFTLAPEYDNNFNVIKLLSKSNIIVSAGHTNANMNQLEGAIDNGLLMFTHLGNGSPGIMPRHDNIINRVLSLSDQIYICFIADGIHLPDFVLNNYLKIAGIDRSIIVTDAMAAASAPPGVYSVSHIKVRVGEDRVVREIGKENLAGSAITMAESEKFLSEKIGFDKSKLSKLLYDNAKKIFPA